MNAELGIRKLRNSGTAERSRGQGPAIRTRRICFTEILRPSKAAHPTASTTGYAGVGLAVLVVLVGVPTALRAGKYGSASTPQGIAPLGFMIVPVFDLLMFVLFFGAAVYHRGTPAVHKSLMLLTAINFLPPALGRIPLPSLRALGPLWFFGVPTALALLCLWLDARRRGRVNRWLAGGTALLVASYVARMALMTTGAWMAVAAWLTTFV